MAPSKEEKFKKEKEKKTELFIAPLRHFAWKGPIEIPIIDFLRLIVPSIQSLYFTDNNARTQLSTILMTAPSLQFLTFATMTLPPRIGHVLRNNPHPRAPVLGVHVFCQLGKARSILIHPIGPVHLLLGPDQKDRNLTVWRFNASPTLAWSHVFQKTKPLVHLDTIHLDLTSLSFSAECPFHSSLCICSISREYTDDLNVFESRCWKTRDVQHL